mmetsp:Transcript_12959/g.23355  ORF Transcript_12959/g.23355 Transcript_12959/m.23355 type:complete len:127 (+) Transcript_12959:7986-8366(+)
MVYLYFFETSQNSQNHKKHKKLKSFELVNQQVRFLHKVLLEKATMHSSSTSKYTCHKTVPLHLADLALITQTRKFSPHLSASSTVEIFFKPASKAPRRASLEPASVVQVTRSCVFQSKVRGPCGFP